MLLNFLKTNKNTRKIFGKRELIIIEKQLNGLTLTQSEKNRLSRDIRPKLNFIKECSNFHIEFKLKKNALNKKLVQQAEEIILNDPFHNKIKTIFLFGSIVSGKLTFRSDLDIAVEFDNIDTKQATLFRKRILGKVNKKIDVQVLNILPKRIQKSVLEHKKILYENKK